MQVESGRYFERAIGEFTSRLAEFEKTIEPLAHPDNENDLKQLGDIMQFGLDVCRQMHQATDGDLERRRSFRKKFLDATAPWCNQSWIIHRARSKPRGFPGDYQMLLAIYDGVPLSRGLGGYLDRWCLSMTLGKAVDSRLQSVKSFLIEELSRRQGPVGVLDIASGPGREFQWVRTKGIKSQVKMSCLDSDDGALEYIRRHASKYAPPNISFQFHQYNAMKLRKAESLIQKFGRQDIIYSVGLADYLPDRILIPMLRCWRESLKPEGCVYVAFKDADRYDQVPYQWLMDWHFLERTERDCQRLFEEAGYEAGSLAAERDATGVILNYISRVRMPDLRRIDREQIDRPLIRETEATISRTAK